MSADAHILAGSELNFDRLVLDNSRKGLVVVDFWAPWAGPSLRQRDAWSRLAREYRGRFLLVAVNTDEEKAIASRFGVKSLPQSKLFHRGEVVETLHGVQPEPEYERAVKRHLGHSSDGVRRAAAQAWQAGEPDTAIRMLTDAAQVDPRDLAIPQMLAKLLMQLERLEQAHKVLAALPSEMRDSTEIATLLAHLEFIVAAQYPATDAQLQHALAANADDHESRFCLVARSMLVDDYAVALAGLMQILRRERNFRDGVARRAVLAMIDTLGGEHELIVANRAELARLIN